MTWHNSGRFPANASSAFAVPAILFLSAVISTAIPSPAPAAMAVTDAGAIAKLGQQINELRKQMQELVKIKQEAEAAARALGDAGSIILPAVDLARLGYQLQRDMACLTPNWEGLMPTVEFDEIDLQDICSRRDFYRKTLFAGGEEFEAMSLPDQNERVRTVAKRRARLLAEAAAQSLAQADQNLVEGDAVAKAADELARAGESADTANERLAAIAQGQAASVRAQARIIQILAQMQRADAAYYMKTGTAAGDEPPEAAAEEAKTP